ncbi:NosL protein [Oceanobacillus limi]|uniref:NosL protein n=1 Tax=Oceanobacillus limi TaxID=930131 RepID=A0A1I0AIC6_9BACI|nr:DeoR family transcriptional regulator [Oceanobacillus limi]SES93952.1 NosL protein [Oceanobacillus limi]
MLPAERQQQIKLLIQEKQHLKISELSKTFSVSEMTIHRDIKPLLDQGIVKKTFGGITCGQHENTSTANQMACVICGSSIKERLNYRIILPESKIETACCAHCGLIRHWQLGDKVIQAICYDFLRQTTIPATHAWFVMDTSIHIGCCQPQILAFELKEHAEKFVTGFGGKIYTFNEAMEMNKSLMTSCHD